MVCGSGTSSIINNNNTIISEAPNRRKARIEHPLEQFSWLFHVSRDCVSITVAVLTAGNAELAPLDIHLFLLTILPVYFYCCFMLASSNKTCIEELHIPLHDIVEKVPTALALGVYFSIGSTDHRGSIFIALVHRRGFRIWATMTCAGNGYNEQVLDNRTLVSVNSNETSAEMHYVRLLFPMQ